MKEQLKNYDKNKVDIFISYINKLKTEVDKENKLVNYWATKIPDIDYINAFKKVYETGLFIDGESVTLSYLKKLVITYDYHAYKNRVQITYPESTFDFQIVYSGDEFEFKKESGKVFYTHKINNPFDTNKQIIGAYGVIKNRQGEFIELITKADIDKFQNSSKMKFIWNNWYDRMVLKSVIKRICSIHFHDIIKDIDISDNETNDPNMANVTSEIQSEIKEAKTDDDLNSIYTKYKSTIDKKQLLKLLTDRKNEFKND